MQYIAICITLLQEMSFKFFLMTDYISVNISHDARACMQLSVHEYVSTESLKLAASIPTAGVNAWPKQTDLS